jgi:hypothetical protein
MHFTSCFLSSIDLDTQEAKTRSKETPFLIFLLYGRHPDRDATSKYKSVERGTSLRISEDDSPIRRGEPRIEDLAHLEQKALSLINGSSRPGTAL